MHTVKRQSAVQHYLFALLLSLTAWASGLHAELAVSLSAPANNSRYSAPATIPLQAEISVSGSSSVSQVAFYQGNTLIGSTRSSPYQWTWENVAAGNYRLTAQATAADGSIVSSGTINLQVGLPGTQVFYIHSDHLNTPRLVTDEQNIVVWRNPPLGEPFGLSPPEEDPDGNGVPFVLNLRFPGQYYDKETNLNYNYYRDYDPATGRYPQSDPIGLRGGINTYGYVGGNPLKYTDPKGLARGSAERLPSKQCNVNELRECKAQCGNRGVDLCFVRRSMQIIGATGEGKKRFGVKEEVICSCNDNDSSCPTNEESQFLKFLHRLTGGGGSASGGAGNPDVDDALGNSSSKSSGPLTPSGGMPPRFPVFVP